MSELIMATIVPADGQLEDADAEPVLVDVDQDSLTLTLDDGRQLVFQRDEFRAAVLYAEADPKARAA